MGVIIQGIPKGSRMVVAMVDADFDGGKLDNTVFNEQVKSGVVDFDITKKDIGKYMFIRVVGIGHKPFEKKYKIKPNMNILVQPREDLLHRRDGK